VEEDFLLNSGFRNCICNSLSISLFNLIRIH
jgi:hypothetical protein